MVALGVVSTVLTWASPVIVLAGGSSLGEDEQQNLPSYFGFARDSHGTFLNAVKVTLRLPHVSFVVRTSVLGAYRIPVTHTEPGMWTFRVTRTATNK
jgi:hypothetical protein